jgi:ribosome-binding factor A
MKYTPEIIFELDRSIEYGAKISEILKEINKQEGESN